MEQIINSLRKQREQLLRSGGEDILNRHTNLLEIAIISLYNRLVNQLSPDTEQLRSSGAIIALGTFGRGLIGPHEKVELLFLRSDPFPGPDEWVNDVVGPLSEAGWKIAAGQASIAEAIDRAKNHFDFLLNILDSRYISGSRDLFEELNERLQAYTDENRDTLVDYLYSSWIECREPEIPPDRWLEPNVVKNPGGLNDIRVIRAICRIQFGMRFLEEAIFQGYLLREEVDQLLQAEKFYLRLRDMLLALDPDSTGVVGFKVQETLAKKLGYSAPSGFLPVEAFLGELCRFLHRVGCISVEFCERFEEAREQFSAEHRSEREIEPGILIRDDRVFVSSGSYPETAASLVHLFVVAARTKTRFSNSTRMWIRHHGNLVETAAGDAKVCEELINLLICDEPRLPLVKRLYNYGLLTALIPELAPVHCLIQHDAFHVYPVHEHHLRTLSELKKLFAGRYATEEPELTLIARRMIDPKVLYLAALLHDIGKKAGQDHEFHGGEIIPSVAKRLALDDETADTLRFLVANHLLLVNSAAMRDLADQEMISQCAAKIGQVERLHQLALLSFADMWATGPKAQAKWRETPVLELCERIRYVLEKGEPSAEAIAARIQQLKSLVAAEVKDFMDEKQLDQHFSQFAPRYLLSMNPSMIARHLRLEKKLREGGEPFVWEVSPGDGLIEIVIVSWDIPGLLARVAGILTLHDLDIKSAQVFSKAGGIVFFIFGCQAQGPGKDRPDWDGIHGHMKKLLEGKLALDYRIALHALESSQEVEKKPKAPSEVRIDNDASQSYTIIEVYTTNRVGLLYTITRTLMDLQLRIHVAKITTKVDQAADIFYVKTADGGKVTDPEQMEEIQNALLFQLDGPSRVLGRENLEG